MIRRKKLANWLQANIWNENNDFDKKRIYKRQRSLSFLNNLNVPNIVIEMDCQPSGWMILVGVRYTYIYIFICEFIAKWMDEIYLKHIHSLYLSIMFLSLTNMLSVSMHTPSFCMWQTNLSFTIIFLYINQILYSMMNWELLIKYEIFTYK